MLEGIWISEPAFGASVDNIEQVEPDNLRGAIADRTVSLEWDLATDVDFQYFTVRRNVETIGMTVDHAWLYGNAEYGTIAAWEVTATDLHGNSSGASDPLILPVAIPEGVVPGRTLPYNY